MKRRGAREQVAHVRRLLSSIQFGAFASGRAPFPAFELARASTHLGFPFIEGEVCTRSVLRQLCHFMDAGPSGVRDLALLTLAWSSALSFNDLVRLTWSQIECFPGGLLIQTQARSTLVPADNGASLLLCPLQAMLRWRSWCFGNASLMNVQGMLVFPALFPSSSGLMLGSMSAEDADALCVERARASGYRFKMFPGCIQTGWVLHAMESGHSLDTVLGAFWWSASGSMRAELPLLT